MFSSRTPNIFALFLLQGHNFSVLLTVINNWANKHKQIGCSVMT